MKSVILMSVLWGSLVTAGTISCTVNSVGSVTGYTSSTPDQNGSYSNTAAKVANGFGVDPIAFSCPAIIAPVGQTITNYEVLATGDYTGGPFGTTSGTNVDMAFLVLGGSISGASQLLHVSGGNSSNTDNPPTPFQIGNTQSGANQYNAFVVSLVSVVTAGTVGDSTGQVVLSYSVTPEPSTLGMVGLSLLSLSMLVRRKK